MSMLLDYPEKIQLLEAYDIPIPRSIIVDSLGKAKVSSREIGYPVSLQGPLENLKDNVGLETVENIRSSDELETAYYKIINRISARFPDFSGKIILFKQVESGREVVITMVRDQKMGPRVIFGLGGMISGILKDYSFRHGAIGLGQACEMVREIKNLRILQGEMGGGPSDIEAIARVIHSLSKIGMEKEDILKIDINPMVVYSQGAFVKECVVIKKRHVTGGKDI